MYKSKTPILISLPRNGSHFVASYLRRHYLRHGLLYPNSDYKGMELFFEGESYNIERMITLFENLRDVYKLDMFNIFHGTHLMATVDIPSRPNIHCVFDWFKEFYEGYQIILLRRRNIWKTYMSWLFHNTIRIKLEASGDENTVNHPWHSFENNNIKEDLLKSTIEAVKPKFVHNEKTWLNFVRDVQYFNNVVVPYYEDGTLTRNWWLEDLTEEQLELTYAHPTGEGGELLIRNTHFKPYSIKYETYYKPIELNKIRDKFMKVYETSFKPYGYVAD